MHAKKLKKFKFCFGKDVCVLKKTIIFSYIFITNLDMSVMSMIQQTIMVKLLVYFMNKSILDIVLKFKLKSLT